MEGPFPADVPSVKRRCYPGYRDAACRQIALPPMPRSKGHLDECLPQCSAVSRPARSQGGVVSRHAWGPRATRLQLGHFAYEPGVPRITHIKGVDEVSLSSYWSDQDQTKRDRDGA